MLNAEIERRIHWLKLNASYTIMHNLGFQTKVVQTNNWLLSILGYPPIDKQLSNCRIEEININVQSLLCKKYILVLKER